MEQITHNQAREGKETDKQITGVHLIYSVYCNQVHFKTAFETVNYKRKDD